MTRVASYARFSTDKQNDRSIEDQLRLLQELVQRTEPGSGPNRVFSDAALSGASMFGRPGLQALLRAVRAGEIDLVVTEHLDRLSRRLADSAAIYDQLKFAGARLVTLAHGEIDQMKIAFIGLQSELFLKDVAFKTRRGQRGSVEGGKSAGGVSYGYRTVKGERGVVVVCPEQAGVVNRILRLFVGGMSPKSIAKQLNAEGVLGPAGAAWSPSTIHGHAGRGTGILNNELYIGKRVWNRQQFLKDPNTGKRVARRNPKDEWIIKDVPDLRIVDDALWQSVKTRQAATRLTMREGIVAARRPRYLFSKLTKCASCGGGFTVSSRDTLRCFNNASRGNCTNSRTITRQELEARVLRAMRERFFETGAFEEFCRAFTEELNRLRMEQRARLSTARRDLERVKREMQQVVEAIKAGFAPSELKAEMEALQQRKATLLATVEAGDERPPLLHPHMGDVYRAKVQQLAAALEHEDDEQRERARESLRGFIDRIVIPPGDGLLQVVGNLGSMLAAAQGRESKSRAVGYVGCGGRI